MKRFIPACMALAASLLASSAAYAATPVTDCPLRAAPFSIESPLVDILLSPAAKAVVQRATRLSTSRPTFRQVPTDNFDGTGRIQSPPSTET